MEQVLQQSISLNFRRKSGKFELLVRGERIEQNVCEFLQTISYLVGKDVEEHLLNPSDEFDQVRIPLTCKGKVVTLDLADFIHFRELYSRQMFLLKLEDLLNRKGISPSI
ncbi:hypothetical protein [Pseudochryseolinea flava]|uniref:Uncharacterized protein n=1 Tax=Pseudochryseolinea flava TaxID=2059302 RepID=A0A364XXK5_9BACT|nr:hypothetical protein [Pseudochryseolinea flava]RAV98954.1 hypothetical protein DQQ10_21910 [Pseudochryseolinea flava]